LANNGINDSPQTQDPVPVTTTSSMFAGVPQRVEKLSHMIVIEIGFLQL